MNPLFPEAKNALEKRKEMLTRIPARQSRHLRRQHTYRTQPVGHSRTRGIRPIKIAVLQRYPHYHAMFQRTFTSRPRQISHLAHTRSLPSFRGFYPIFGGGITEIDRGDGFFFFRSTREILWKTSNKSGLEKSQTTVRASSSSWSL